MLTIEQRLKKIQAISSETNQIDGVIQRIQLNMDKMEVTINNIHVIPLLSPSIYAELRDKVLASLSDKRQQLIVQAEELMK